MDPITKVTTHWLQTSAHVNPKTPASGGFEDVLKTFLNSTIQQMNEADQKTAEFAVGKRLDIHEVVIASEKAGIQFSLLMNIRNKLLEAYQEVMRMQF